MKEASQRECNVGRRGGHRGGEPDSLGVKVRRGDPDRVLSKCVRVCMCVHVCAHVCMCACVRMHVCGVHVHARAHRCVHTCDMCVRMHTCVLGVDAPNTDAEEHMIT